MRLGIFGGTFDPVHLGHLILAESCREAARLDEVWFVPAATPPHKKGRPLSDALRRIEMLELAIAGHPQFRVCRLEIERGGVSYTVDTLRQIRALVPEAELFLLLGADSLEELHTWREADVICELALPLVVRRANHTPRIHESLLSRIGPARWEQIRAHMVDMPLIELSSTEIRDRVAQGRSIRYRVPRAVEEYIRTHGLYQPPENP
jgi:nicotinate-nucleotide adenylyltransferase